MQLQKVNIQVMAYLSACCLSTRFGGDPVSVAMPPILAPYATLRANALANLLSS